MENLVTVAITSYNHANYIEECIESIYNQSFRNIELIIIDDASSDNSTEIINEMIKKAPFPVEKIFLEKNKGLVNVRNIILEKKLSKYVLFVDSDNFLPKNYIEELIKVAEKDNADIIYTDLKEIGTDKIFMKSKEYSLASLLEQNYIDSCSLIRTSIIGEIRYDQYLNYKKLEDYDFFLNLIINQDALPKYCNSSFLNYRVLTTSLSRKGEHNSEKYYYELYLYILNKHINKIPYDVINTLNSTIKMLESRISDLIDHLGEVTSYVHSLERNEDSLKKENSKLNDDIRILHTNYEIDKTNKINQISELNIKNSELSNTLSAVQNEKLTILNSKPYKIGSKLYNFGKLTKQIIRNPKLIVRKFYHLIKRIIRKIKKIVRLRRFFLIATRSISRRKNNYSNPSRLLVYVVYESKPIIQEYKLLFLKKISKIVDRIVIISNSELSVESEKKLEEFGEVHFRENAGYDTAAFRYGINLIQDDLLSNYDELLLINDTNIGPFGDLDNIFKNMGQRRLDFWGISYGEEQPDFTGLNPYGYIPKHLQSYFLVIEKSLFSNQKFYEYWNSLEDTNSREKAIGRHETVFTRYFEDLGFKQGAVTEYIKDSPMYIHPLTMLKKGVPIVKYSAFSNYNNDKFLWQGLVRDTEVPELVTYIRDETDYPISIIDNILVQEKNRNHKKYILIIDGVENIIPQLTTYRVNNKIEQLESLGFTVWHINLSSFEMGYAENASHIIIYRAVYSDKLALLLELAKKDHKPVLYDIDDLVIDTSYTDQLSYVQNLSNQEKLKYDSGVNSYGSLLKLCDGAIASTKTLGNELAKFNDLVLLNRNLASKKLIEISEIARETNKDHEAQIVKIGYFSGSITHNENFDLIRSAIIDLMTKYENIELHLVGHIDLPEELKLFKNRVVKHSFVDWKELPYLISKVDINLAPLTKSIFNEAKSEIKWIEASLVKVVTVASKLGAFDEQIDHGVTGILVEDSEWYEKLSYIIENPMVREKIAENAYDFVIKYCSTENHKDQLTTFLEGT